MQTCTAATTLERGTRASNLPATLYPSALPTAVALPPIAASANQNLAATRRARTRENPKRLVDHRRWARRFLDKRRESSDTADRPRDHAAPESLELQSGLSTFVAGRALYLRSPAMAQSGALFRRSHALSARFTRFWRAAYNCCSRHRFAR